MELVLRYLYPKNLRLMISSFLLEGSSLDFVLYFLPNAHSYNSLMSGEQVTLAIISSTKK